MSPSRSEVELNGSTALVTGASRGIGAATARHLAACGANVVLAARSGEAIQRLAAEIQELAERSGSGAAMAKTCDVSQFEAVDDLVRAIVDRFGTIDLLVNNAGAIEPIARLVDSDPKAWAQAADVNFKGVYHTMRAVLPVMLAQSSGGVVIQVSSGAATSALDGWSHYCSSKAAALALTRCADLEYRDRGIRVVGLSPGTVATGMQVAIKASGINPVSQLDPSDHIPAEWVARAIAWLSTEAAAPFAGRDFELRDDANRRLVGLS